MPLFLHAVNLTLGCMVGQMLHMNTLYSYHIFKEINSIDAIDFLKNNILINDMSSKWGRGKYQINLKKVY